MRIQRSSEHRLMPWANGLGVTAEICAWPPAPHEWAWRLSIADVNDDGPFSELPGVDRHIIVADGIGMGLTVDGSVERRIEFGSSAFAFSGDVRTYCRLLDGPIADLNLMVRREHGVGALLVERLPAGRQLGDTDLIRSYPQVGAVVVIGGHPRVGTDELTKFDAVLTEEDEAMPTIVALDDSIIAIVTLSKMSAP
jgi:environmental stress-induced protein Ves